MEELKISQTRNTPEIILDPAGKFRIRGRSIHEDIDRFFLPVEDWIGIYVKSPADLTRVDMNLEYFNSTSARLLVSLLLKITHVTLLHKRFVFNWYFEEGDEDIKEKGEYISSVLNVPFNFIKIKLSNSPAD